MCHICGAVSIYGGLSIKDMPSRCFVCIVMDKLDGGDLVEGLQRHLKAEGREKLMQNQRHFFGGFLNMGRAFLKWLGSLVSS